MIITVYEDNVSNPILLIDDFVSLIWTERYYAYSDFEMFLPLKNDYLTTLQVGQYIGRDDSSVVMIVEKLHITRTAEENYLHISGRSLSAILGYRVIEKQTLWTGTVEGALREMVYQKCVSNDDKSRQMPITLGDNNGWAETFNSQFGYENLGEWIQSVCKSYKWGFNLIFNGTKFQFNLYKGQDRSSTVLFSFENGNIFSYEKYFDNSNYCNVAFVGGEGEGVNRKIFEYEGNKSESPSGIDRREIFIDASVTSSNEGEIPSISYQEQLYQQAMQSLNTEYTDVIEESISAETGMYKYRTDYNVGDIVSVDNGFETNSRRIIEMIENYDETGYTAVPTFE